MAASTYKLKLRLDALPVLRKSFPVNVNTEPISPGDIVELGDLTGTLLLLQDDQCTADYKYVGIADGTWNSSLNDSALIAAVGIPVILYGVFEAILASGTYVFGDALEYNASTDDGSLAAFTTGSDNQLIAWIFDSVTGTVTSSRVFVNVLDNRVGTLETTS